MSNGHAAKGGEIGVNGDAYKGGQFLPSTNKPKGKAKARKAPRVEIEPGVFAETAPGIVSLYGQIAAVVTFDRATRTVEPFAEDHPIWRTFPRDYTVAKAKAYNDGNRFALAGM